MYLLAQFFSNPNLNRPSSSSSSYSYPSSLLLSLSLILSPIKRLNWLTTLLLLLLSTCLYCSQVAHSTNTNQLDKQNYDDNSQPTFLATTSQTVDDDLYEIDSFKAIRTLHSKLDDDADGEVNDLESKKFLESGKINQVNNDNNKGGAYSTAHKLRYLHQDGKDRSISVDELWEAWRSSQVHNWTVEETIYWLVNYVELPEYSPIFEQNSVNGSLLPRLAADSQYISSKLGITDPSAKSRISIKAMDVVLFGPPKLGNASKVPYIIVNVVILIAISSCYVFYSRSRASQLALQAIQEHLESLQKAQDQLKELQHQSDQSKAALGSEKRQDQNTIGADNRGAASIVREQELDLYVSKLEDEIKCLRGQLDETNNSIASKKFRAPFQLKSLLQATYNIESRHYNDKKHSLETKATEVKLRNQKLQKKKTSFLGYYKMAQENSLEEDLNIIVEVKEAIMQMAKEVKERSERWKAIEEFCGCSLDLTPIGRVMSQVGDVTRTPISTKLTSNHRSAANLHSMGSSMSSSSSKSHLD